MRIIPFDLTEANSKLTRLTVIERRDGEVVRFTNAQSDIVTSLVTYSAQPGVEISAIENTADGSVPTFEIVVTHGTLFDMNDLRDGRYDSAVIDHYVVDRGALSDGMVHLFRGRIGDVQFHDRGKVTLSARGKLAAGKSIIMERFSPTCRADLGDRRCKIAIYPDIIARSTAYALDDTGRVRLTSSSPSNPSDFSNLYFKCITAGITGASAPSWNAADTFTTVDGTVVWQCHTAYTRSAQVVSVTDARRMTIDLVEARASDATWFVDGAVIFTAGHLAGLPFEVESYNNATKLVTFIVPLEATVTVGQWLEIYPGCNKTIAMCVDRFDNAVNFRGEPHVPGQDAMLASAT